MTRFGRNGSGSPLSSGAYGFNGIHWETNVGDEDRFIQPCVYLTRHKVVKKSIN